MRDGCYEVTLVKNVNVGDETGSCIQFVERVVDGEIYAIAEPGQEYFVKVSVYRNSSGLFPSQRLRIGLFVDGVDVNYWKRIDLSQPSLLPSDQDEAVCASFWGFKKNNTELRSFVFATPSLASKSTGSNLTNLGGEQPPQPLGQIKVVIYEAVSVGGVFDNTSGCHEVPTDHKVHDDKKFWQQASVATTAGRKLDRQREAFNPVERWMNATSQPVKTLTLLYHTKSMLDMIVVFMREHKKPSSTSSGVTAAAGTTGGSTGVGSSKRAVSSSSNVPGDDGDDGDDEVECVDASHESVAKRARKEPIIVDLTEDDDDDNVVGAAVAGGQGGGHSGGGVQSPLKQHQQQHQQQQQQRQQHQVRSGAPARDEEEEEEEEDSGPNNNNEEEDCIDPNNNNSHNGIDFHDSDDEEDDDDGFEVVSKKEEEEEEDPDIQHITVSKQVPMLDMSGDGESSELTYVIVSKGM